jgi:hypothetical protein
MTLVPGVAYSSNITELRDIKHRNILYVKVKGKDIPVTGHGGP